MAASDEKQRLERELIAVMGEGKPTAAGGHDERFGQRVLRRLYVAHVLQCLSTTLREQSAPGLVYSLFQNDMVASAAFLGSYDSASGLIAFMVSPS